MQSPNSNLRSGKWNSNSLWLLLGEEVHSMTLGIVGYGGIGRAVARRAVDTLAPGA